MAGMLVLPMFTVDSFASKSFSGNPAAVCLDQTDVVCISEEKSSVDITLVCWKLCLTILSLIHTSSLGAVGGYILMIYEGMGLTFHCPSRAARLYQQQ